jgi:steroid delta-isomerase-like uncharacterized protein
MSDAATALITAYYAAFNRGDAPAMLALLTDDVRHDINQGGMETGREAFAAFLAEMARCYRETLSDIVILSDAGGKRAAAEYVVNGIYLEASPGLPPAYRQSYNLPGGAFFEIREGKIARVTNYYNLPEWLAQVSPKSQ